jgi:TRAP-type C4-dicarboxylate transport system permease small subunit
MAESKAELRKSLVTQITVLMTTAFGLIAALAWNAAIQALFVQVFGTTTSLVPMFTYAIVVTLIAVVVIFYLSRVMGRFSK